MLFFMLTSYVCHEDVNEIHKRLEENRTSASVCFRQNKLHLNVKTIKWLLFGTRQRLSRTESWYVKVDVEEVWACYRVQVIMCPSWWSA